MKELIIKYYNLFNWDNGDNTCIQFTVFAIILAIGIGLEVYNRVKKHRSLFF